VPAVVHDELLKSCISEAHFYTLVAHFDTVKATNNSSMYRSSEYT
jgi:hypothetical protein